MISVIITTYNYGRYLERSIRSCLDQSLGNKEYEVIVVDDASTDITPEILANYKDEIRVFSMPKNVGLSAARNFGIKKAKGQFVVFLDADDYLHGDLLMVQRLFLYENNAIDAVSVDYYTVNEKGKHLGHMDAEKDPIACGIMFRKDYLYDIGLYDEAFKAREEEDLRIRWLKKYNIHNLIIPLYRYRKHDANLTNDSNKMDKFKNLLSEKHEDS